MLDNFEWSEGWSASFGLYALDRETQERKLRPSGELYASICRTNGRALAHDAVASAAELRPPPGGGDGTE